MLYDHIGAGYAARRTPDPRIAGAITLALDGVQSIANVGAGTGSYELPDKTVIAIEPSMEMLRQRASGLAPRVQAVAESLPLRDKCVSGATAILTIHHWSNLVRRSTASTASTASMNHKAQQTDVSACGAHAE